MKTLGPFCSCVRHVSFHNIVHEIESKASHWLRPSISYKDCDTSYPWQFDVKGGCLEGPKYFAYTIADAHHELPSSAHFGLLM